MTLANILILNVDVSSGETLIMCIQKILIFGGHYVYIFFRITFKYNIHNNFQLSLVDLAGSERVGKTGASADQLKVGLFPKIS